MSEQEIKARLRSMSLVAGVLAVVTKKLETCPDSERRMLLDECEAFAADIRNTLSFLQRVKVSENDE